MGPLAACVYGADKALPLHDTHIHTAMGYWVGRPVFQQQQMLQHPHS